MPENAKPPELLVDSLFIWMAFLDLSSCAYFEGGPIPFNEIVAYGEYMGLERDEIEELTYFVSILHNCITKHHTEQRKNSISKTNIGKK